ncbi:MAG: AEC family transporter [SAR324 cluster bacterium]|nr:AEC family transporter [SAR324 cluster bacterium]
MKTFEVIFPIFLTGMIGWLLVKSRIINEHERNGLSKITFLVFVPMLLFQGTYSAKDFGEISAGYVLAFYIPVLSLYLLSRIVFNKFLFQSKNEASFAGLGTSYSNVVLVGIPVLLNYLGDAAIVPAFFIISVHSIILFTLTSYFTETTKKSSPGFKNLARALIFALKNPLVSSLMLGISFNYFDIALPDTIVSVITLVSKAALPSALIVLGGALAAYPLVANLRASLIICVLKLGILPLLVWLFATRLFHLNSFLSTVIVVLASTPVGVNVYALARDHQKIAPVIAASILLSTLMAIFTIPFWLYIIR